MSQVLTPEAPHLLPPAAEEVQSPPPPKLPPRPANRNDPCTCGSGRKYKRCCMEREGAARREARVEALPEWLINSERRLHQFTRYSSKVFNLPWLLGTVRDSRRDPQIPTFDVVNSLFHAALLRIPSLNALEGNLKEEDFQKLLGLNVEPGEKAFSADTIARVLDKCDVDTARNALAELIRTAERNKMFRDGSYGGMRCVAIDAWEAFRSEFRHCDTGCLTRQVGPEGNKVTQYYHKYVVAMLLGPKLDLILAFEPVRNQEVLRDTDPSHKGHEGELTAAHRLLARLHETYGGLIEFVVTDALYANGPWMTKLDTYGYSAIISLQKENNEPLKEAINLFGRGEGERQEYKDPETGERVVFSDIDDIQTLSTYAGKVRVIKAEITKPPKSSKSSKSPQPSQPAEPVPSTWYFALTGSARRKLTRATALKAMRSRWHIENTAFNQFGQQWNLEHVFRHTPEALHTLFLIWMLAFNMLQFFIYCHLGWDRNRRRVIDTIRHIVEVMMREVATLPDPIPWRAVLDSGG